ncbi:MAG: hypothetical protein BWY59_00149 [Verrucomicrobia bacterium ADurb.Bin345]|nr:MAG: hypothetical protein BWY59_00149 [Verrucomicrobia bacterium ADurb.Bin345]
MAEQRVQRRIVERGARAARVRRRRRSDHEQLRTRPGQQVRHHLLQALVRGGSGVELRRALGERARGRRRRGVPERQRGVSKHQPAAGRNHLPDLHALVSRRSRGEPVHAGCRQSGAPSRGHQRSRRGSPPMQREQLGRQFRPRAGRPVRDELHFDRRDVAVSRRRIESGRGVAVRRLRRQPVECGRGAVRSWPGRGGHGHQLESRDGLLAQDFRDAGGMARRQPGSAHAAGRCGRGVCERLGNSARQSAGRSACVDDAGLLRRQRGSGDGGGGGGAEPGGLFV